MSKLKCPKPILGAPALKHVVAKHKEQPSHGQPSVRDGPPGASWRTKKNINWVHLWMGCTLKLTQLHTNRETLSAMINVPIFNHDWQIVTILNHKVSWFILRCVPLMACKTTMKPWPMAPCDWKAWNWCRLTIIWIGGCQVKHVVIRYQCTLQTCSKENHIPDTWDTCWDTLEHFGTLTLAGTRSGTLAGTLLGIAGVLPLSFAMVIVGLSFSISSMLVGKVCWLLCLSLEVIFRFNIPMT